MMMKLQMLFQHHKKASTMRRKKSKTTEKTSMQPLEKLMKASFKRSKSSSTALNRNLRINRRKLLIMHTSN